MCAYGMVVLILLLSDYSFFVFVYVCVREWEV